MDPTPPRSTPLPRAAPRPGPAQLPFVALVPSLISCPPRPPAGGLRDRLIGAAIAAIALAPLLTAAGLTPDPSGHGTHLQLGMAPCGFLAASGLPCATCGMTTSFAHAANGDLLGAAAVQPAGALLALLCAVAAIVGGYAAVTGLAVTRLLGPLVRGRVVLAAIAVLLAAWGYTAWRFTRVGG